MNTKTTVIALGIFVALLAAVLLTREDRVSVGVPKLALPALGEVTAIEVSGANQARLALENGAWTVGGHPADAAQMTSLLSALKLLRATDFVTDKPERHAELEVDDAKGTRVAITTASGPGWQLVVGKAAKGGGTYLREAASAAVFTTPSPAAVQLKRGASGWRDKTIATAPAAEVVGVTVTRPEGALSLAKGESGWQLEAPPKDFRFDAAAAERMVQQLTTLRAQDFLDGADTSAPQATTELRLEDGKTVSLRWGAKRPDNTVPLTVDGNPQVFTVGQWVAEQALKGLEELRDTSLLSYEPEKVRRVSLSAGGKTVTLAKEGAGWKVLAPKVVPAGDEPDAQAVGQQLLRWRSMRALRTASGVADTAAGLGAPTATLELTLDGGARQLVRFGGESPTKELYVKGATDGLLYVIAPHERAALERGLELFKKRAPPDPGQIRGLEQLPPEVRAKLEAQLRAQQAQ